MAHGETLITLSFDEIAKCNSFDKVDEAPSASNKPLIQMVPQILRSCYGKEDCERFFKPTSVVIGPLNCQREIDKDWRIKRDKEWKEKLAAAFIQNSEGTTQDFYQDVKKEIKSLRNCYNSKEVWKWNGEDLAWMFLVDGCALLGFMILDVQDDLEDFSVDNDLVSIERIDFFLLENQLPYQLLKILIGTLARVESVEVTEVNLPRLSNQFITKFINGIFLSPTAQKQHQIQVDFSQSHHPHEEQQQEDPDLLDLLRRKPREVHQFITKFIDGIFLSPTAQQQHQIQVDHKQQQEEEDPAHLLDLLRRRLMGIKSKEKGEKQKRSYKNRWWETRRGDEHWPSIRNVRVLKGKGIRFKAREKGGSITDIDFNDHCRVPTLTLAPIFLHNTTMPLLLNLMAYELCPDFKEDCKITSYLSFLDSLIDTEEDVKDLRDAGVLDNGLGSDKAAAELFNKISGIPLSNLKIDPDLRRQIHGYNKSHLSRLRASIQDKLIHTYFRSPWSYFVFLGALAGLIMTGMQTYNSFHENKLP